MNKKLVCLILALMLVCMGAVGLAAETCTNGGEHTWDWYAGTAKWCTVCYTMCEAHVKGDEPDTLDANGACEICDYQCEHEFSTTTSGELPLTCYNCDYVHTDHDYNYDGVRHTCEICDFQNEYGHEYGAQWDENGKCEFCGEACQHSQYNPGTGFCRWGCGDRCQHTGVTKGGETCAVCGSTFIDLVFDPGTGTGTAYSVAIPNYENGFGYTPFSMPDPSNMPNGSKFTAPAYTVFDCWEVTTSGGSKHDECKVGEILEMPTQEEEAVQLTATAQWAAMCKVTYEAGEGATGTAPEMTYVAPGGEYTLPTESPFTHPSKVQTGWHYDDGSILGVKCAFGETITIYRDSVITPIWGDLYVVKFVPGVDGEGEMDPEYVAPGSYYTPPSREESEFSCTEDGKMQAGWRWWDAENGEYESIGFYDSINIDYYVDENGEMTLEPTWTDWVEMVEITFDPGEGLEGYTMEYELGDICYLMPKADMDEEAPEGKVFKCWLVSQQTDPVTWKTVEDMDEEDWYYFTVEGPATAKAVWIDATILWYTLTIETGTQQTFAPISKPEGEAFVLPEGIIPKTQEDGTTLFFKNFNVYETGKESSTGETMNAGASFEATKNMTAEAVFDAAASIEYTITYTDPVSGESKQITQNPVMDYEIPTFESVFPNVEKPENRTFIAWYSEDMDWDFVPGDEFPLYMNTELSAVWTDAYTVTFDGNGATGGSMADQVFLENEEKALTANDYTREGYNFLGWSIAKENGSVDYADEKITKMYSNMTLYAVWEPLTYKVTVNYNDDTNASATDDAAEYDSVLTLPTAETMSYTKTGHTFSHWEANGEKVKDATYTVKGETILNAVWTPNKYSVNFATGNGASGSMPGSNDVSYGTVFLLPEPSFTVMEGYTFLGWYDKDGNKIEGTTITVTEEVTLTAQWQIATYTITYDLNGVAGSIDTATVEHGNEYSLAMLGGIEVPKGKTFGGWLVSGSSDAAQNGMKVEGQPIGAVKSNLTVTAVWNDIKFTVTYYTDSTLTTVHQEFTDIVYDHEHVIISGDGLKAPTETVEFYAWDMYVGGEVQAEWIPGEKFNAKANYTFAPQWIDKSMRTYTMSFNLGASTSTLAPITAREGKYFLMPFGGDLIPPAGMHFGGWEVGGVQYIDTDPKAEGDTLELTATALWIPNEITVTYFDGDRQIGETENLTYLQQYSVKPWPETVPEGKVFAGWLYADIIYPENSVFAEVTESMEFVAQWKNTYTLSYNANGGNGTMVNQTFIEDVPQGLSENLFGYPGYTFTGWNTAADGTGTAYTDLQADVKLTENTTLYAQWLINTYTITFDGEDSPGTMDAETREHGKTFVLPECKFGAPVNNEFRAWNVNGKEYNVGDEITVTEDLVIKPIWLWIEYTVSFDANGGVGALEAQKVLSGTDFTLPACSFEAPVGHSFGGWKPVTKESFDYKDSYSAGEALTVFSDVTLQAQWTPDDLAITFELGEFGGDEVTFTQKYGVTFKLPYVSDCGWSAYQDDYVFLGWNLDGTYYGQGAEATLYSDTTYTAMWADRWYSFSFIDSFDGAKKGSATVEYGDKLTLPSPSQYGFKPHTEYHTFAYWSVGGKAYMPNETITYSANKTIKAMWDFKSGIETITVETPVEIKEEMTQQQVSAVVEQVFGETETKKLVEALNAKSSETITEPAQIVTEIEKAVPPQYDVESMTLQNVELMFKPEGSDTWIVATKENFPTTGIAHTLDFNEGTSPATHDYLILHMLVEGDVGSIETIAPERIDADGVTGRFYSLSPVSLVAKAKPIEDTYIGDAMAGLPETGDPSSLMGWITLLGASGIGLRAMKRRKK